jgi:hypothetical protein
VALLERELEAALRVLERPLLELRPRAEVDLPVVSSRPLLPLPDRVPRDSDDEDSPRVLALAPREDPLRLPSPSPRELRLEDAPRLLPRLDDRLREDEVLSPDRSPDPSREEALREVARPRVPRWPFPFSRFCSAVSRLTILLK